MTPDAAAKTPSARYDYHLPRELIAQKPIEKRSRSRLLVLHHDTGAVEHKNFTDFLDYPDPGDVVVVNDTRVIPAEISLEKTTGAAIKALVIGRTPQGGFRALMRPGKRLRPGMEIKASGAEGRVKALEKGAEEGEWILEPLDEAGENHLERGGKAALPHYIHEPLEDQERYQTIFARNHGSLAAPTAGLHFDQDVISAFERKGIPMVHITLHVGLATFRPIKADYIEDHCLGPEYWRVDDKTADIINGARASGGKVWAVGTTTTRTLETAGVTGMLKPGSGETELFITEGFQFRIVDRLLTNFHLPRSTLLTLVCAFGGHERVMAAYARAVEQKYRFYSFGDAMLIV